MDEKKQQAQVKPKSQQKVSGKFFLISKTIWINILVLIVALVGFVGGPDFPVQLSPEILEWLLFIQAMANLVLRFITDQPLRVNVKK